MNFQDMKNNYPNMCFNCGLFKESCRTEGCQEEDPIAKVLREFCETVCAERDKARSQLRESQEQWKEHTGKLVALTEQRDWREEQFIALRDAFKRLRDSAKICAGITNHHPIIREANDVLFSISNFAQETIQRIEREALEKAWARDLEALQRLGVPSPTHEVFKALKAAHFGAAILGEKDATDAH